MQSSRDSSVWRSLAVSFGDGLAFGVGMTLTQPAGRASVAAPQTDLTDVAHRLDQMEQRIAEIERVPRTLAPAERAAPPAQPFDQKVLEAVVNALDARLHEHAGQVERRITDLQAKVTIEIQSLHQQDRSIADGLQALRNAAEGNRVAMREQVAALHHDVADILAGQVEALQQQLREEVRQTVSKMAAMAASAAESAIEEHMAPLRAAVEAKDREIAELRARLAGSDQATLDLLQGVGEICRRAAQRLVVPQALAPEAPATVEPPAKSIDDSPQVACAPVEPGIPGFAQPKPPGRLLRIPLVSSLVLTTGMMLIVHYL